MQMAAGFRRVLIAAGFAGLLAGCTTPQEPLPPGEVFDPYENVNRSVHKLNRGLDRALFRPASKAYVTVVPSPLQIAVANFAENLGNPAHAVDYLLQGNLRMAGVAASRFVINTTIGLGGIVDPATTEFKLPEADTDFGETLAVWGVPEGAYQELPGFGPSTERATVGLIVALFTNPVSFTLTRPINNTRFVSEVFRRMGDRGNFSDTVDSVLYDSADSYAQSRLIYLQNRQFELSQSTDRPAANDSLDPYADPYGEGPSYGVGDPYIDEYSDPYEDPYAE